VREIRAGIAAKRGLVAPMQRLLVAFAFLASPCLAANTLDNRPAFSAGDLPPERHAACEEVRTMSVGLAPSETRIDLAVEGRLTLVKTDGVLWYLVMCSDVRVMCVTYQGNDMKAGDRVLFMGGYKRLDENHAVLDPCLANAM
jgi:hypothetical protein